MFLDCENYAWKQRRLALPGAGAEPYCSKVGEVGVWTWSFVMFKSQEAIAMNQFRFNAVGNKCTRACVRNLKSATGQR